MYQKQSYSEADQSKLLALQINLCAKMEDLFSELGISLVRTQKMYFGPCPVHGGDNAGALNIYFGGESVPGYWRCQSRHCENIFKRTIIGFVRGVLSHQKFGWTGPNSKQTVGFGDTIQWCCRFLGVRYDDLQIDRVELEKRAFAGNITNIVRTIEQGKLSVTRQQAIAKLDIPAQYFINRGWSPEILQRFDVGTPKDNSKLRDRIVVPIYDDSGQFFMGATARSIHEECGECGMYHPPTTPCPDKGDRFAWAEYPKWKNINFNRDSVLYNFWNSKGHIRRTGTVVIVEGPGDLWRLEEAGIRLGVAMLGTSLSDQQQIILEMSGAMNVVIATNTDAAGIESRNKLKKQLGRMFRIYSPSIDSNDLGDLSPAEVREVFVPLLTEICR